MYICMPAYIDVKSESGKNDRGFLLAHRRGFVSCCCCLEAQKIHLQARCIILKMTFHTVHSAGSTKTSLRPHTSSEVCFLTAYMESLFLTTYNIGSEN